MKNNKYKGFTLIELLVVVAIIGILATVVLASLGQARTRAKDAAVLSGMSSYRTQVELDYPTGDYTGLCLSSGTSEIELYIQSQGGDIEECEDGSNDYRIIASLPSSFTQTVPSTAYAVGEDGFCINSLGTAEKVFLEEMEEITVPACNSEEEVVGPAYGKGCNDYSPEYTGCYDSTNMVWVDPSYCVGLPPAQCR